MQISCFAFVLRLYSSAHPRSSDIELHPSLPRHWRAIDQRNFAQLPCYLVHGLSPVRHPLRLSDPAQPRPVQRGEERSVGGVASKQKSEKKKKKTTFRAEGSKNK